MSQTTNLNVRDFGARGDAVQILASTLSNSTTVYLSQSNSLSTGDVGKLIELFGVGNATSGTNYQDLIARIVSVTNGTNVTISLPAGRGAAGVNCTIGTQNSQAFQSCINACQGSNCLVLVPAGRYLLVPPPVVDPNGSVGAANLSFAFTLSKGGIRFLGAGPAQSVLLGNGAWVLKAGLVQRGAIAGLIGPITNNTPLVFEGLTFDGGVQVGNGHDISYPPSPVTGNGWDPSHGAVFDWGHAPLHASKSFVNCTFAHWRGEMLKSLVDGTDGMIVVTNCVFLDGTGSGFNFNFTHQLSGCLFSNLFMAMELYEGYMNGPSIFENSLITNVYNAIVVVGAVTNHTQPPYTIRSNLIWSTKFGILLSPVRNMTICSNRFFGCSIGIGTDNSGYQGSDYNRDITIQNNEFNETGWCVNIAGSGVDRLENMVVQTNAAWGCSRFADGYGWSTNVVFQGNQSYPGGGYQAGHLWSGALLGQFFIDDVSNDFPTNAVYVSVTGGSPTNTISYKLGARHVLYTDQSGGYFLVDDSNPGQMPTNAVLLIKHGGGVTAPVKLSTSNPAAPTIFLSPGDQIQCLWSNGQWKVTTGPKPEPPDKIWVSGGL